MISPNPNSPDVDITAMSVDDQPARVVWHGQEHKYNLAQILSFKDDLEEATATHAQLQSYWENLAVEVQSKAQEFEEVGYAKWWAHARRYARLVMHALQVKETLESLKDWTVILFGKDLSDAERETYAQTAFRGWLLERLGTAARVEAYVTKNENPGEYEAFRQGMLGYYAAGWTYEKVQKTMRSLKEQAAKTQVFARAMNDRSFKMKEHMTLVMAKHGNVNPFQTDSMQRSSAPPPARPVGRMTTEKSESEVMASLTADKTKKPT